MIFVRRSDIVRYFLVIVIFYCANTTAFPMSDWKISEGVDRLNRVAKMGLCLKIVEKTLVLGLHLGVTFTD